MTVTPKILLLVALAALPGLHGRAQQVALPDAPLPRGNSAQPLPLSIRPIGLGDLPANLWSDQRAIWTSPRHLNESRAVGPVLLAVAVAVVATTDHRLMSEKVPLDASWNHRAETASNGLLGGLAAAPVALYGLGRLAGGPHLNRPQTLGAPGLDFQTWDTADLRLPEK